MTARLREGVHAHGPPRRVWVNGLAVGADTLDTVTEETSVDIGTSTDAEMAKAMRAARILFGVGAVTLSVLALALIAWIDLHNDVWGARPGCNPFGVQSMVRGLISLMGGAGLMGLAVSGLWLGIRPSNRTARRVLWSAIGLAWLAVGGIAAAGGGVFIDCALVT